MINYQCTEHDIRKFEKYGIKEKKIFHKLTSCKRDPNKGPILKNV